MKLLGKPPRIKVLEAAGCIGDSRIKVLDDERAIVSSSSQDRSYRVILVSSEPGVFRAYSDDNGTIHRGYIGYPIIAFMILKGFLPIDNTVASALKGVPWRELNEKYKKYSLVENMVLARVERMGVSRSIVDDYVNIVLRKLGLIKVYFDESLLARWKTS